MWVEIFLDARSSAAVLQIFLGTILPRQESTGQRKIWNHADVVFATHGLKLTLEFRAFIKVVFGLEALITGQTILAAYLERRQKCRRPKIRRANSAHFPQLDEFRVSFECLVE